MSCIVAYKDKQNNIWMGGDSIGVMPYEFVTIKQPKVFCKNNMVFGFEHSFRMGQIIQYDFFIPPHHPDVKDFDYMVSHFIESLQDIFSQKKYSQMANSGEFGGTFLVAYNQKIYKIEDNYQIIEIFDDYISIGYGSNFARGSFWAFENMKTRISPADKVKKALECATHFSYVKPPFHILKLPHDSGLNS